MQRYPAVFLDRDGTINEEVGYLNHLSRLRLIRGVGKALRTLQERGVRLFVVTNQSGPARGYFPKELVERTNEEIRRRLRRQGVVIEDFFVCLHHPDEGCSCRKPRTGLLEEAFARYPIDRERAYVVGDRLIDVELARNAGLKGILVLTGYGRGELEYVLPKKTIRPDYVAEDLSDAVRFILRDLGV